MKNNKYKNLKRPITLLNTPQMTKSFKKKIGKGGKPLKANKDQLETTRLVEKELPKKIE